jgi:hypothetical protein
MCSYPTFFSSFSTCPQTAQEQAKAVSVSAAAAYVTAPNADKLAGLAAAASAATGADEKLQAVEEVSRKGEAEVRKVREQLRVIDDEGASVNALALPCPDLEDSEPTEEIDRLAQVLSAAFHSGFTGHGYGDCTRLVAVGCCCVRGCRTDRHCLCLLLCSTWLTRTYTRRHMLKRLHSTHTCTYTHALMCLHRLHTCMHDHTCSHMRLCAYIAYTHACTNACSHVHTYTHTRHTAHGTHIFFWFFP